MRMRKRERERQIKQKNKTEQTRIKLRATDASHLCQGKGCVHPSQLDASLANVAHKGWVGCIPRPTLIVVELTVQPLVSRAMLECLHASMVAWLKITFR